MITFKECDLTPAYKMRTVMNVRLSQATLMLPFVWSPGEHCTEKACRTERKLLFVLAKTSTNAFYDWLERNQIKKLNIAGNGMYTLAKYRHGFTQEYLNDKLHRILEPCIKLGLEHVRTGGQTGIDEAGAIAAARLGVETEVLAPKGWIYRPADGIDVFDEIKFKSRFKI